ncbi:11497_t:CDS:2 [Ambispora gerdemannii]|uniref:11497_t:CDS:1 n=1 Tax=Ambispora gerdemannii TaxID=144530 RepID=A0A9N9B888_9GLOM|nr:11497_t:CDS:2 [Ambispora gerdemannii]
MLVYRTSAISFNSSLAYQLTPKPNTSAGDWFAEGNNIKPTGKFLQPVLMLMEWTKITKR